MKAVILVYLLSVAYAFEYLSATVHSQDVKPSLSREIWHPRLYLAKDSPGTHFEIRDRDRYYETSVSFLQRDAEDMPGVMNCRCRFTKHALKEAENFLQVVGKEEPKKASQVKSQDIPLGINQGVHSFTELEQHAPMHSFTQNTSPQFATPTNQMQGLYMQSTQKYPAMIQQNDFSSQNSYETAKERPKSSSGQELPMTQYANYQMQFPDMSKPLSYSEMPAPIQYAQPYQVVYKPIFMSPEQTSMFYSEPKIQPTQQPAFMNQIEMPNYYPNNYQESNGLFLKPRVANNYPSYPSEGYKYY